MATEGGVFSAGRLDLGTQVLLRSVGDPPPSGTLMDLGCGWGPIALAMATASPAARVLATDINPRALALTAANAAQAGLDNVQTWTRSEEHTSELQSRGHLVCRLLLEKKKKTTP